jgi:hypothetical protein
VGKVYKYLISVYIIGGSVTVRGVGIEVRVYPEVERLVREVSDILGYSYYTIRNTAILYGLMVIANGGKIPDTDLEFLRLVEIVRYTIKKGLGDGEKRS